MKIKPISLLILGTSFFLNLAHASANETDSGIQVTKDVKHDTSQPLSGIMNSKISADQMRSTLKNKNSLEPIMSIGPGSPLRIRGFQGIGVGLGSYTPSTSQPDAINAVGMNQIVQLVNSSIAVFNKSTGAVASGFPKPTTSIWAGFGPQCENFNLGPVAVIYDQFAHRWVISQYSYSDVNIGPYYQCVAVSTSEDATGTYNRYAFQMDSFNDFGVIALWPDAYYMTFNMLGRISTGPRACALERDKMLVGDVAQMQCKQFTSAQTGALMPASLTGSTNPPAKTPAYLMSVTPTNNITLFKYYVDFANPNNTVMSGAINIPVSQYAKACAGTAGDLCAIQPNTTNRLNLLSDRLMRNLVYRQFTDHGSLVANHTVEGPPPKYAPALRWYEFRFNTANINPNPVVFQQSTLAPDSKNRFIGSISIDKSGNIALGYSVSSSLIFPSLELAARNYFDPSSSLTIQALFTAHGSQINDQHSWGRYSMMSVDPSDDCTFWYSNEYLQNSGSLNWSTYIVNFKLAACT